MIYGYKVTNGTINYLGASDEQERLVKALTVAGVDIDGVQFTDVEPVDVNGKYYLSAESVEYKEAEFAANKERKIADFKARRDAEEVETISYGGNSFDYDDKARERLAIARQALEDTGAESILWTTADNQRVDLTVGGFIGINAAAAMRSNALHVKYNILKERVQAAQTQDELDAVTWDNEV